MSCGGWWRLLEELHQVCRIAKKNRPKVAAEGIWEVMLLMCVLEMVFCISRWHVIKRELDTFFWEGLGALVLLARFV